MLLLREGQSKHYAHLALHLVVFTPLSRIVCCSHPSKTNVNFQVDLNNEILSSPPPLYQACAPLYYGHQCQHHCTCSHNQDCNDGPPGDGSCSCPYGSWNITCFLESSPLIPEEETDGYWVPGFHRVDQRQLKSLSVEDTPSLKRTRTVEANLVHVLPTPFKGTPMLLAFNIDTAKKIGWTSELSSFKNIRAVCDHLENNESRLNGSSREETRQYATELAQILSGSILLPGSTPYAHAYGGHQFGSWSGQLGDGRAISLGERCNTISNRTENNITTCQEISTKGGGKTPFSRAGDGRATLQLLIREYLASIALPSLGIPSVQSLALVASEKGNEIIRDEWYSGDIRKVPSGTLVRVAPSMIRLGGIQLASMQKSDRASGGYYDVILYARWVLRVMNEMEMVDDESSNYVKNALKIGLYDKPQQNSTVLQQCFFTARSEPSCASNWETMADIEVMKCLLRRTSSRLASLVASWNAAGFTHGVLNTDNVSPLGLTIDLNVYGFIDRYEEDFVSNKIDDDRRYSFGRQKDIMEWNLWRLVDVVMGREVIERNSRGNSKRNKEYGSGDEKLKWITKDVAENAIEHFRKVHYECRLARLKLRLGLPLVEDDDESENTSSTNESNEYEESIPSKQLVNGWIRWLRASKADYHRANRALAEVAGDVFNNDETSLENAAFRINSWSGGREEAFSLLISWLGNFRLKLHRESVLAEQKEEKRSSTKEKSFCNSKSPSIEGPGGCAETKQFVEVWASHMREVAPHYILRTSFTKDITLRILESLKLTNQHNRSFEDGNTDGNDLPEGITGARVVVAAATKILKDPFEKEEIELSNENFKLNNDKDSFPIYRWLRDNFSALSPPPHTIDRRSVQTSCGGQ